MPALKRLLFAMLTVCLLLNPIACSRLSPDLAGTLPRPDVVTSGEANFLRARAQFCTTVGPQKSSLREVFVTNRSTVWNGGRLEADSDADGLSDAREATLGARADSSDSDGNRIGDGVETLIWGTPCGTVDCAPTGARNVQALCGMFALPGSGGFPDSDNDSYNDCEEMLLVSDWRQFDTAGYGVPDGLVIRLGLTELLSPEAAPDEDGDGVSFVDEIRLNTPVGFVTPVLVPASPYRYDLRLRSQDALGSCYDLEVSGIVALSPTSWLELGVVDEESTTGLRHYRRVGQLASSPDVFFPNVD